LENFIAKSPSSKNSLNMALVATSLPVNVLILGEIGVGKRALTYSVSSNASSYNIKEIEDLIREKKFNFDLVSELIIFNIDKAVNLMQLLELCEIHNIRLIATATSYRESFKEKFLVRIDIPPLSERLEDIEALKKLYLSDAKKLFSIDEIDEDKLIIDLSQNAKSLRRSIYQSVSVYSMNKDDIFTFIEQILSQKMEKTKTYKELLELFEIPLLQAAKKRFKSQVKMADNLDINRNTLRKKILQYGLDNA
jgi:DNA-binding NtrC family response regulator